MPKQAWLKNNNTSPKTNAALSEEDKRLVPNFNLKQALDAAHAAVASAASEIDAKAKAKAKKREHERKSRLESKEEEGGQF